MKIVTTPMCEEILRVAGIENFDVSQDLDSADADIAVVLSETITDLKSVKIKLNTFPQIEESVRMLREIFETTEASYKLEGPKDLKLIGENRKIKVKVFSNFLRWIVEDL
jgi:segregation and condensation protein B